MASKKKKNEKKEKKIREEMLLVGTHAKKRAVVPTPALGCSKPIELCLLVLNILHIVTAARMRVIVRIPRVRVRSRRVPSVGAAILSR